jgi:hypothetical protein
MKKYIFCILIFLFFCPTFLCACDNENLFVYFENENDTFEVDDKVLLSEFEYQTNAKKESLQFSVSNSEIANIMDTEITFLKSGNVKLILHIVGSDISATLDLVVKSKAYVPDLTPKDETSKQKSEDKSSQTSEGETAKQEKNLDNEESKTIDNDSDSTNAENEKTTNEGDAQQLDEGSTTPQDDKPTSEETKLEDDTQNNEDLTKEESKSPDDESKTQTQENEKKDEDSTTDNQSLDEDKDKYIKSHFTAGDYTIEVVTNDKDFGIKSIAVGCLENCCSFIIEFCENIKYANYTQTIGVQEGYSTDCITISGESNTLTLLATQKINFYVILEQKNGDNFATITFRIN